MHIKPSYMGVHCRQSITITIKLRQSITITGQFQSITITMTRPSTTSITYITLYNIYCVIYISIMVKCWKNLDKQQLLAKYIIKVIQR